MQSNQPDVERVMQERVVGRYPLQVVRQTHADLTRDATLTAMLDAIADYALVLNDKRQIVAVNRALLETFGMHSPEPLLGMRPGEVFNCSSHGEGQEGCGTGLHCTTCGAVSSILTALESGRQVDKECRLITANGIFLDLQVTSTPVLLAGREFLVSTFRDISALKRRDVLERLFFHDLLNTAGGIHGLASLLAEEEHLSQEQEREYKGWMKSLSSLLLEEIRQQRRLALAERGDFVPDFRPFSVAKCLEEVRALYATHQIAEGKILKVDCPTDISLSSDESVVRRILGNLVKNALEATPPLKTVTLLCNEEPEHVIFRVHNAGVMSEEVKLQVFRRSFSTKSTTGRGIGTYSVKLFGERYLKGKVKFFSDRARGTEFSLVLPKQVV